MPQKKASPRGGTANTEAGASATPHDEVVPVRPGEVTLHQHLTIIEVTDPADLTSLLADPRLAKHVVARLGSTAAAVLPQSVPRLLMAMLKAGHTPRVLGER